MGAIDEIEARIAQEARQAKATFERARKETFVFNENLRLDERRADTKALLNFVRALPPEAEASAEVRRWYANGPVCEDRPGVLAVFHPAVHKREGEWERIYALAQQLAKDLERWIWITLGEDRWVRLILGPDPRHEEDDESAGPLVDHAGTYQNDQSVTAVGPCGEEHFVGCS